MAFKDYESLTMGDQLNLDDVINNLKLDENGLIPAIAQQFDSGKVMMMAWMNEQSIRETLKTGIVCYWSRSRQSYWRKGESSGHVQHFKSMSFDCDGDAILLQVDQHGPACHTNRDSCFYLSVNEDHVDINSNPSD